MSATNYDAAARVLLRETGCTVRKWRSGSTGVAYVTADDWGIEAPRPAGPISFGILCHEIGHQLLHRGNSLPRWLEEIEAWEYALRQFDRFGLNGYDRCRLHAAKALGYAIDKAARRHPTEKTALAMAERYGWVFELGFGGPALLQLAADREKREALA
jgi:hypothetical protein